MRTKYMYQYNIMQCTRPYSKKISLALGKIRVILDSLLIFNQKILNLKYMHHVKHTIQKYTSQ